MTFTPFGIDSYPLQATILVSVQMRLRDFLSMTLEQASFLCGLSAHS